MIITNSNKKTLGKVLSKKKDFEKIFYITFILLMTYPIFASATLAETNLVLNPSFENGTTTPLNWVFVTQNANTPVWDTISHTGSKSIKISISTYRRLISGYPKSDLIPVQSLETYVVSAWGKTKGTGGSNAPTVTVVELDTNKNFLKQTKLLVFGSGTNGWTQKTSKFTAGSASKYLYVYANILNGYGTFWVDDVMVSLKNTPTPTPTRTPTPTPTPTPVSSLIFKGDFETGNTNQWEAVCAAQASRVSIMTSPVRQGNYAARFTVNDGDSCLGGGERAEVAESSNEKEGTDVYYAWSTLFPSDWKTDTVWGTVFNQYHDFNDRSPPLAFIADELGGMVLVFCTGNVGASGDCSAGYYSVTLEKTLTKGLWHDFILHVKWSTTNAGHVEVWHRLENQANFTKILNITNRPTLQWKPGNPAMNATITTHQLGLYRSSGTGFSQTLYQDGYRIGTSYDSVLYNVHTRDTMKINYDYVLAYLRNLKEQYGGYFGTDLSNLAHELKVMIFGLKKIFGK